MSRVIPKILLVEDEPDVCSSLQSYFGRRGYQVTTTASGTEALALIKAAHPRVIILDFALNDLNGRDVLKELRKQDKRTKVIVLTGQMLPAAEIDKVKKLGVTAYLTKPVVLEKLGELVGRTAGRKSTKFAETREKTIMTVMPPEAGRSGGRREIVHKLSNLLGIIRNKCENFNLNLEEGIYRTKTDREIIDISSRLMREITESVDKAMEVIDKIKSEKR